MKDRLAWLVLLVLLAGTMVRCGATPEPTQAPPTQTPWIIIATATAGSVGRIQPTQTPWIIVVTPTGQAVSKPTATERPTVTRVLTRAAGTPEPDAFKYPAPVPLEPPNERPVGWKDTVTLEWSSVGELAADEYYHLHLDAFREVTGEHWYGDYVYTKDTTHLLDQSFLNPFHPSAEKGQAVVYWWVWVVRKTGEDEDGKPLGVDIGVPSEKRYFVTEPKPDGM